MLNKCSAVYHLTHFQVCTIHVLSLWYCGRGSGLVVSALDSGSRGPGSSPGWVIVLCSWARHFTLTVSLSTQEYKWVPANCQGNLAKCWWVTSDALGSHPGGVAILLVTSCYRNRDKLQLCGPLGLCAIHVLCLQLLKLVIVQLFIPYLFIKNCMVAMICLESVAMVLL